MKYTIMLIVFFSANAFAAEKAKIVFTGDILMHQAIKKYASKSDRLEAGISRNNSGFDILFEYIAPILTASDIAVGNMEFPIKKPYIQEEFIFNCPPGIIGGMKNAGFDILTNANNHILDQGSDGVASTLNEVRKGGFIPLGVSEDEKTSRGGYIKEINGIKIAFYATTGLLNYPEGRISKNNSYYINWFYDKEKVKEDIKRLKAAADIMVFIFHTGNEYTTEPLKNDMSLCREYADAGADILIGHHPHVLQPFEEYKKPDGYSLIFYSLGNFISDQNRYIPINGSAKKVNLKDSAIVRIVAESSKKFRAEIVPVFTNNIPVKDKGITFKKIQTYPTSRLLNESRKINDKASVKFYEERISAVKEVIAGKSTSDKIKFCDE